MPNTNDRFTTELKDAHLGWGTHRGTGTRTIIQGEAYLQIPKAEATRLNIYNSNQTNANTEYTCSTSDNFLTHEILKASGSTQAGDIYAKQFAGSDDLKLLGTWFAHINAQVGDRIDILWTSPTNILLTKI